MKIIIFLLALLFIICACEDEQDFKNHIYFEMDGKLLDDSEKTYLQSGSFHTLVVEIHSDKSTGVRTLKQIDLQEPIDISQTEEVQDVMTSYGNGYRLIREVYIDLDKEEVKAGQELKYSVQINTKALGDFRKSIVFRVR